MNIVSPDVPINLEEERKLRAIRELNDGLTEFYKSIIEFSKGAEKLLSGFYYASARFNQALMTSYELIQLKDSINEPANDSKNRDA